MILNVARREAEGLRDILAPYCKKIEIAGSIRREKPEVKDIEFVCIPDKSGVPLMQFFLSQKIEFKKNGRKYKQFHWAGLNIDFFITDEYHWGLIYLLRTGSKEFNIKIVAELQKRHLYMREGELIDYNTKKTLIIKEERDIFDLIKWNYIPPQKRI